MKKLLLSAATAALLFCPAVQAQQPPTDCSASEDRMREMYTRDQGDICIAEWNVKVKELTEKYNKAAGEVSALEKSVADEIAALKKCRDEIYSLIGATEQDVNNFRERLGRLEGKVREMEGKGVEEQVARRSEILGYQDELNKIRGEKIALLPEFFPKVVDIGDRITRLLNVELPRPKGYTVGTWAQNRDCLWNISGKSEIYNDPFQWPKLWQGNTDQIRNPDVIHPGQVLKVPPAGAKTSEEMKAERSYWRKKRAAMEAKAAEAAATPAAVAPTTTTPATPETQPKGR